MLGKVQNSSYGLGGRRFALFVAEAKNPAPPCCRLKILHFLGKHVAKKLAPHPVAKKLGPLQVCEKLGPLWIREKLSPPLKTSAPRP